MNNEIAKLIVRICHSEGIPTIAKKAGTNLCFESVEILRELSTIYDEARAHPSSPSIFEDIS